MFLSLTVRVSPQRAMSFTVNDQTPVLFFFFTLAFWGLDILKLISLASSLSRFPFWFFDYIFNRTGLLTSL